MITGFLGTVIPVLPGAPLAWLGLLCAHFSSYSSIPLWMLIVTGVVAVFVSVMDNIFPIAMTKKSGGSSWGTWGCTIGLVVGFFAGPLGILVCPFFGALIGELIHNSNEPNQNQNLNQNQEEDSFNKSLRAALGAFKGFLAGIGIKMAACGIFIWIFIYYIIKAKN